MQPTSHTSKDFDAELERIRLMVLTMGGICEQQVRYAVEALGSGDLRLVAKVMSEEGRLNELESRIDEFATTTIARRAPTANDLRMIVMVLKTCTDLERIGDEAKKIALIARQINSGERLRSPGSREVKLVTGVVLDMLRRALDAFARLELDGIAGIARLDEDVDQHFKSILRQLLTYMIEDPRTISPALDMIFVAKALERVGDHAKNISEYVVYVIKGRDVRHTSIGELENAVRS